MLVIAYLKKVQEEAKLSTKADSEDPGLIEEDAWDENTRSFTYRNSK